MCICIKKIPCNLHGCHCFIYSEFERSQFLELCKKSCIPSWLSTEYAPNISLKLFSHYLKCNREHSETFGIMQRFKCENWFNPSPPQLWNFKVKYCGHSFWIYADFLEFFPTENLGRILQILKMHLRNRVVNWFSKEICNILS